MKPVGRSIDRVSGHFDHQFRSFRNVDVVTTHEHPADEADRPKNEKSSGRCAGRQTHRLIRLGRSVAQSDSDLLPAGGGHEQVGQAQAAVAAEPPGTAHLGQLGLGQGPAGDDLGRTDSDVVDDREPHHVSPPVAPGREIIFYSQPDQGAFGNDQHVGRFGQGKAAETKHQQGECAEKGTHGRVLLHDRASSETSVRIADRRS
jgi:hypothetical protein